MNSAVLTALKTTVLPKKSGQAPPTFHIMTVSPLTKRNLSDHIFQAFEAMCEMNFLVSVIAEGDEEAQEQCFRLVEKYPKNFAIHEATDQNRHNLYKEAHVVLLSSKPSKKLRAEIVEHKIVPVLPINSGFEDFNAQQEHGHGFTFQKGNFWQMLCAVMRASENQKFKYDWKVLKKNLSKLK